MWADAGRRVCSRAVRGLVWARLDYEFVSHQCHKWSRDEERYPLRGRMHSGQATNRIQDSAVVRHRSRCERE
jgi:hypothetical protein